MPLRFWRPKKAVPSPGRGHNPSFENTQQIEAPIDENLPKRGNQIGCYTVHQASVETSPVADIVFVHGLTGGSHNTWCRQTSTGDVYWPQDLLPKEQNMPNVRILTFGYNAEVLGNFWKPAVSNNSVMHHAENLVGWVTQVREQSDSLERPLVFVMHSLGGLVVQAALDHSRGHHKLRLQKMESATVGLCFMGTPHFGSPKADWGALAAMLLKTTATTNTSLIKTLKSNSPALENIQRRFYGILEARKASQTRIDITCFYEELAMPGLGVIVPRSSAIIQSEDACGINANHQDMVRYKDAEDPGYQRVVGDLCSWLSKLKEPQVASENLPQGFLLNVPSRNAQASEDLPVTHDITHGKEETPSATSRPTQSSTIPDVVTKLLNSLRYDHILDRQSAIPRAHDQTCAWFEETTQFREWRDTSMLRDHHGLLWIKGKPGAGKSTIMKYVLKCLTKDQDRNKLVISYFFNGNGQELEKSTTGMYRSLLWQLFRKSPDLQDLLDTTQNQDLVIDEESPHWTKENLKGIIEAAVHRLRRPLFCLLDALDECEEVEAREMVFFVKHLCGIAIAAGAQLYVCLASRPYPHISSEPALELVLETQPGHDQDIATYIETQLSAQLCSSTTLPTRIQERSGGIFLWVFLVINDLNQKKESGYDLFQLLQRLEEVPPDLYTLIRNILRSDPTDRDATILCMQWVMCAQERLDAGQLHLAIQCGRRGYVRNTAPAEHETEETKAERIRLYITFVSRGLVEITASTVQFIHQSVLDFVRAGGLHDVWPDVIAADNFMGRSHQVISMACLDHVKAADVEFANLNGRVLRFQKRRDFWEKVDQTSPLLRYAVGKVLDHAKYAAEASIPQGEFFARFELYHKLWYPFWDSLHPPFFEKYRKTAIPSVLYILAENDLGTLISAHPSAQFCGTIEEGDRHFPAPLLIAACMHKFDALEAFTKAMANAGGRPDLNEPPGWTRRWLTALNRHFDEYQLPRFDGSQTILPFLARKKIWRLLDLVLVSQGANMGVDSVDRQGRTALCWAAACDGGASAQLLLDHGAQLEHRDAEGQTPLFWAARCGHADMVELLLKRGASVDQRSTAGRTPLLEAAKGGHTKTAQMLVDHSPDIDAVGCDGMTPLNWAAATGRLAVVLLLLKNKASTEISGQNGKTPLLNALEAGHGSVALLLQRRGADCEASDACGERALHKVAKTGDDYFARLLLRKHHVEIDARDGQGATPLILAAASGHIDIVQMLLQCGADMEARDATGRTPLIGAAIQGHFGTVRALLEVGADSEAVDSWERMALDCAATTPHKKVRKMLLEHNAAKRAVMC
ncbi:ankyrin repeat domain-containing protein 50 [Microdochium nivale]|nr:ankyrin repeat domain-containing protein 50 [Microdochium nivale]